MENFYKTILTNIDLQIEKLNTRKYAIQRIYSCNVTLDEINAIAYSDDYKLIIALLDSHIEINNTLFIHFLHFISDKKYHNKEDILPIIYLMILKIKNENMHLFQMFIKNIMYYTDDDIIKVIDENKYLSYENKVKLKKNFINNN